MKDDILFTIDWKNESHITIDEYCTIRNGLNKDGEPIVALTNAEFKVFNINPVSGWRFKLKNHQFDIEVAVQAAMVGISSTKRADIKQRLTKAFFDQSITSEPKVTRKSVQLMKQPKQRVDSYTIPYAGQSLVDDSDDSIPW